MRLTKIMPSSERPRESLTGQPAQVLSQPPPGHMSLFPSGADTEDGMLPVFDTQHPERPRLKVVIDSSEQKTGVRTEGTPDIRGVR